MIEHKHVMVRATVKNPPFEEHMDFMARWLAKLVSDLEMKILAGPTFRYVHVPGNRGMTGFCIIETSHISMHIWDEEDPAVIQFDVYTCGKMDLGLVFKALQEFNPVSIEYKYFDREHGLKQLDEGMLECLEA